jgi:hypothetical protein
MVHRDTQDFGYRYKLALSLKHPGCKSDFSQGTCLLIKVKAQGENIYTLGACAVEIIEREHFHFESIFSLI